MSVIIITGMDMPESCRVCIRRRKCPQWNRRSLWKEEYIVKRSDSCPLKSIDDLISRLQKEIDRDMSGKDPYGVVKYKEGLREAIEQIKNYCDMKE